MTSLVLRALAWLGLGIIVVITLAPLGMRPIVVGGAANLERFAVYFVVATLFVCAYPRRLSWILALVCGLAVFLEVLQTFSVDRHGRLLDLAFKLGGACLGGLAVEGLALARRGRKSFGE